MVEEGITQTQAMVMCSNMYDQYTDRAYLITESEPKETVLWQELKLP